MSTNSSITVKVGDSVKSIYCHWDGYPSHNGRILLENYNNQEAAEKVVSVGDLSVLAESMESPEHHSFENAIPGHSIAYGRDRGEKDVDTKEYGTHEEALEDGMGQEFNYYWDGSAWLVDGEELTKEIVSRD